MFVPSLSWQTRWIVFHRQNSPKQRRFVCSAQDVTGAIVSSSRQTPMQVRKRSFFFLPCLILKTILLPRQARDKHRESSTQNEGLPFSRSLLPSPTTRLTGRPRQKYGSSARDAAAPAASPDSPASAATGCSARRRSLSPRRTRSRRSSLSCRTRGCSRSRHRRMKWRRQRQSCTTTPGSQVRVRAVL